MKESFPTAEFLDAAVVSRGVMEQLEAIADEAVAQGSWFEVRLGNRPPACTYFVFMSLHFTAYGQGRYLVQVGALSGNMTCACSDGEPASQHQQLSTAHWTPSFRSSTVAAS